MGERMAIFGSDLIILHLNFSILCNKIPFCPYSWLGYLISTPVTEPWSGVDCPMSGVRKCERFDINYNITHNIKFNNFNWALIAL